VNDNAGSVWNHSRSKHFINKKMEIIGGCVNHAAERDNITNTVKVCLKL
jgi:hypothetical protein